MKGTTFRKWLFHAVDYIRKYKTEGQMPLNHSDTMKITLNGLLGVYYC